jgi:transposase
MSFRNSVGGRMKMIDMLKEEAAADGARVIFAYEASGQGFALHDELTEAGIECHVLAPTRLVRSPKQARAKTDEKDADQLLQLLRAHVLAGNPLPDVWIPDATTRDDREIVRMRMDLAVKSTRLKSQVRSLLKRWRLTPPDHVGSGWSAGFQRWLKSLVEEETLLPGARETLASLLRQLEFQQQEQARLEKALVRLAESERYAAAVRALFYTLRGVGVLTALIFLAELGDPRRFSNRRQLAAYLGLVPTSFETGERNDCKGHITRQGPSRVRGALCQAAWARVRKRRDEGELTSDEKAFARIVAKNPKHKKIATVAVMRRLAIRMWHKAREAWPPDGNQAASPSTRQNPQLVASA